MLAVTIGAPDSPEIDRASDARLARDAHVVLGGNAVTVGKPLVAAGLHRVHQVVDLVHPLESRDQRVGLSQVRLDR